MEISTISGATSKKTDFFRELLATFAFLLIYPMRDVGFGGGRPEIFSGFPQKEMNQNFFGFFDVL